jgi:predicted DNA-binding transcriptional regulator YafY
MKLVLEVDEKALFHFTERPLTAQQEIKKIQGTNLYEVSASVPDTYYLRPFLLSMRTSVTVLKPVELQNGLASELKQMLANYAGKK